MDYDLALSRAHQVDVVAMPFLDATNERREAQFTIGWQMDTSTVSQPDRESGELTEPALVSRLHDRSTRLTHHIGQPFHADEQQHLPRFG